MKEEIKNSRNIPTHIGLILDGNRRWAQERNLPTFEGHRKGYNKISNVVRWFFSRGVSVISFYVFSTENWNRSEEEVNYLMKLLQIGIEEQTEKAVKEGYRLFVSGRIDELPGDLPESCHNAMAKTKNGDRGIINICLNYGGRAEIVDAFRKMMVNKVELEQIHEGMVRKYLYSGSLPDPDVIVRTSGEQRLSGFLLWESAYSELIFMKKYWPDFEEPDVDFIIDEYNRRNRRFGE